MKVSLLPEVACAIDFARVWQLFRRGDADDDDFSDVGWFCDRKRPHVGDDYALTAAMSGWTPTMFMTRVRL
jgi:hypothetical protein